MNYFRFRRRVAFFAVFRRVVLRLVVFRRVDFLAVFRRVVFLAVFRRAVDLRAVFRRVVFLAVERFAVFLVVRRLVAFRGEALLVDRRFFAGMMVVVEVTANNSTALFLLE